MLASGNERAKRYEAHPEPVPLPSWTFSTFMFIARISRCVHPMSAVKNLLDLYWQ
jgi:hypothetical protein